MPRNKPEYPVKSAPLETAVILSYSALPWQLLQQIMGDDTAYQLNFIGHVLEEPYEDPVVAQQFENNPEYTVYFVAHDGQKDVLQAIEDDKLLLIQSFEADGPVDKIIECGKRLNALQNIMMHGKEDAVSPQMIEIMSRFFDHAESLVADKKIHVITKQKAYEGPVF